MEGLVMIFIQYIARAVVAFVEAIIYWIFFNGVFERKRRGWNNLLILSIFPTSIFITGYFATLGLPVTIKLFILFTIGCIVANLLFQTSLRNIIVYQGLWTLCSVIGDSVSLGILSLRHGSINVAELLNNFTIGLQITFLSKTVDILIVSILV
ncbi:hypothetical protein CG709_13750 [Lachnotalea glycerini]|nr:hypothetical protein CG709_13750 [Lachnotalea glycerini]